MTITYVVDRMLTAAEFIDILQRSTLAERRPVSDRDRIQRMLDHADLLVTAWDGEVLVGVARAVTDWSFCCYLSDLAVDQAYQRQGIGKALIAVVQAAAGDEASLVLLAAPAAAGYYPHIGMQHVDRAWALPRKR